MVDGRFAKESTTRETLEKLIAAVEAGDVAKSEIEPALQEIAEGWRRDAPFEERLEMLSINLTNFMLRRMAKYIAGLTPEAMRNEQLNHWQRRELFTVVMGSLCQVIGRFMKTTLDLSDEDELRITARIGKVTTEYAEEHGHRFKCDLCDNQPGAGATCPRCGMPGETGKG